MDDDRAQALTEYVIIIPIVLLFFFAFLQYFAIVRASQLANYAAYAAARSYAVHDSVDGDSTAADVAKKAASLAMAPVAGLAAGEAAGLPFSPSSLIPSDFPSGLSGLANIALGYATAYYVRFDGTIGGGSVNCTNEGTQTEPDGSNPPKQVDVTINYPQPIFLPGLAEAWSIVAGDGLYNSMKPLRQGLTGIPGTALPAIESYEQAQQTMKQFDVYLPNLPFTFFPYVNVQAKCSIGYEDWGSQTSWRPRAGSSSNNTDASPDPNGQNQLNNIQQQQQQTQQDGQTYQNDLQAQQTACNNLCSAQTAQQQAQQNDNAVRNNPKSTQQQINDADSQLSQANSNLQSAQGSYSSAAQSTASAAQSVQNDTGQNMPAGSCPCSN
jgi:hypothetical protein